MQTRKTAQSSETVTRRRLLQAVGVGGVGLALGARPGEADGGGQPAEPEIRTWLTESFGLAHPFVASVEAYAHPEWKRRIVEARRQDTVLTTLFGPELPYQPYHVLRNPAVDAAIDQQDEICGLPPSGPPIGFTVLFPGTAFETPGVPIGRIVADMMEEARLILAGRRSRQP